MSFCVIWSLVSLFVVIFQCSPVSAEWNLQLQLTGLAKCLPPGGFIFGFEAVNVVLDILILCLPMYKIKRLQLPTRRKISISAIFLLGGL